MLIKLKRFASNVWQGITNNDPIKRACQDQAEKLAELARVLNGLPVNDRNAVILWLGPACPADYEEVAALAGAVPLGTTAGANNVGTAGGSMSHQNTIPAQGAGTTGATSVDAHTHPVTDSGVKVDSTASASVFVALHTSIATSTTTGTSHTHATAAHDHGGLTGFADHTPLHLKVLFCRRRLGT